MKRFAFAITLVLLSGCAEQMQQMAQQRQMTIWDKCSSYGFKSGTPQFAQCAMQLDQQQQATSAAVMNASVENQRRNMEQLQRTLNNNQLRLPSPPPAINCTSNTVFGTVYTNCR